MKKGFSYIAFLLLVAVLAVVITGLGTVVLRQKEICRMDKDLLQAHYMGIGGAEYFLKNKSTQLPLEMNFENCGFKIQSIKGKLTVEGFAGNPRAYKKFSIEGDKIRPCAE
jgi:hypothetical protein